MRALERNKQKIYYSLLSSNAEIVDENGLPTGEYGNTYTTPQSVKVNVSANKGVSYEQLFGTDLDYTKQIVSDKDLGFDENTILWVDKEAVVSSAITPHNFNVVAVAKSLNYVVYAIRGVDVSADSN